MDEGFEADPFPDIVGPYEGSYFTRTSAIEIPLVPGADVGGLAYFIIRTDFLDCNINGNFPVAAMPRVVHEIWNAYAEVNFPGSALVRRVGLSERLQSHFELIDPGTILIRLTGENADIAFKDWETIVPGQHSVLTRAFRDVIIFMGADGVLSALCGNYDAHLDTLAGNLDQLSMDLVGLFECATKEWVEEDDFFSKTMKQIWAAPALDCPMVPCDVLVGPNMVAQTKEELYLYGRNAMAMHQLEEVDERDRLLLK